MKIFLRFSVLAIIVTLVLYACNIRPTPTPVAPVSGDRSVGLAVQATNASTTFNTVGQVINYSYTVTNTGDPALAGPVTVTDDKTTVPACAAIASVGNLNNNLDKGESVICVSSYSITQNDLNAGSVISNATAQVAGTPSNRVTTTVPMASNKVLVVTVTPNTTTYTAAGQVITYTYSVKNNGATTLTPTTQFVVTDNRIPTPINCDVPKELAPGSSLTCTANYTVTQNDMGAPNITSTVTASGGGVTSPPVTTVVTRGTVPGGNYIRDSNIPHSVVSGEWLYQIARCYNADIKAVLAANPQIPDPHLILPAMTVNVPKIGSKGGTIYGPPCVGFHVVQSGDTWDTIKAKYNADLVVLQAANRNATLANGTCLKIPLNSNSAGGATPAQSAAASCPTGTTPPSPNVPIRITIPTGSTSVTLPGTVQASGRVRYVFTANQGQQLSVRLLNVAQNDVTMGIIASNGSTMKAQDATLTFSGTLPSSGDSFIDIFAVSGTTSKSFTLEVTITTPAPVPSVERVADINSGINSSDPAYLAVFNGTLFFKATGSDNTGGELWKYDIATKTPSRVTDQVPGAGGFDPAYLTVYNGALYFKANGGDNGGSELWRFNGSATGRLTDINSGPGDANPAYLAVFNNMLYFSAKGSDNAGVELWRTDGTTTVRAADINAGPGDSNPAYLTVFNNILYFSAVSTDGMGVELWKYDGTNLPTRVSDINPGVGNSNPAHLAVFNNALYFSANKNDGLGIELWKYDGTANPPTSVADVNVGAGDSAPSFLTVFNNALYFSAIGNDGTGIELWKYDGTTAKRVADINTVGNSSPSYLVVFNNELYFQANGNDGVGTELWKFKGP